MSNSVISAHHSTLNSMHCHVKSGAPLANFGAQINTGALLFSTMIIIHVHELKILHVHVHM